MRGRGGPWIGVVPISGYPVRHKASNRPCRAEEPFRRPHVTGRTQHRVNQVPVAIDRPIQVAPLTVDLQVGLIGIPALARPATGAVTPLTQRLAHHRRQLRLPLSNALMADSEPTQQHDLAEIPECQPVAQPAEYDEGDNITWQRCSIEDAVAALVELRGAIAHRNRRYPCAVRSRRSVTAAEPQPTQSIAISPHPAAILRKLIPCCYSRANRREA